MSGPDELYPPAQYGWGWILLVFGILVAIVLVVALVLLLTRRRRAAAEPAPPLPFEQGVVATDVLREEYLAEIARVEQSYRDGGIDARRANLELSRTVRRFVNEYSGLEAPVLALDDLVRLGVQRALVDAIRHNYYPSVFRRGEPLDPASGADAARTVVTTWR
ncbi:hypothetical protein GCM10025768_01300 [Microbacterium pseudoresistens]|uniref:Uncharacterized SAM-binding protein YcdF (DUF218 family) n=1 Tax=Microbacterium pseudoresistens TaxID=640634 RepID=A0A7Y9JM31_9MICO|nr:hypothetical protein [Microbacterium pseudoresistens]NYD53965.1 uncharacterized SAM-binding protein YcdF (DUF218 family) [Microbacterium pseudoresistens]